MKRWLLSFAVALILVSQLHAALMFKGYAVDAYGDIGDVLGTGSFSVSGWVYISSVTSEQGYPWSQHAGGGNRGWYFRFEGTNPATPSFAVSTDGTAFTTLTSATPISTKTWTHYGIVYNAAATQMKIYINGVIDSFTAAAPASRFNSTAVIKFGAFLEGAEDDVAFWNVALTDNEMAQLGKSRVKRIPLQIRTSSQVRYFMLDQLPDGSAAGSTLLDSSPNKVNATAANAPTYRETSLSYP